jgi:fatty-acyl-CoA synthase
MSDTYKSQNYIELLSDLSPELEKCPPGDLKSSKLPFLKNVIQINDKRIKYYYKYDA